MVRGPMTASMSTRAQADVRHETDAPPWRTRHGEQCASSPTFSILEEPMHTSRSILSRRWLGAGAAAVVLAAASPTPATAAGGDDPPEQATGWYLALGDSLATGYQPDRGEDRAAGYVGPVLAGIRAEQPKTKLITCPATESQP